MACFKCKMCGGELDVTEGSTIAVCRYCGSKQTLPRLDDDRRATLYERASHFRRNNEFDKAASIYEQILSEDNRDAEAYWSLVLCRYGIEYVEDPQTRRRIPTINRSQFTSIFDDENYKAALYYADSYQRSLYEQEAHAINNIQKGILSISQQAEKYDVFICYKESDQYGRRTLDSVLATDLYHLLTQEGFKVFFSRITLEDKLGSAYEPYIFAALNSAKVMVVLGTSPEHFQAPWVRNEWSRYLALIKQGQPKVLIPAYKNMDPYHLPGEFAHLQGQDMSRLGFMQDLIHGIKKIIYLDPAAVKKEVMQVAAPDKEALLKRASLFLEDQEWRSANNYCEKVLDVDPECAEAYLYKLMAELQIAGKNRFKEYEGFLASNANYNKVMRFADPALKQELTEYDHICRYNHAVTLMNPKTYDKAKVIFDALGSFADARTQSYNCSKFMEQQEAQKQRARQEKEQAELAARRRRYSKNLRTTSILNACFLFALALPFLLTDLHIENDEGLGLFILSIIAMIPLFIVSLVLSIRNMVDKRKISDSISYYQPYLGGYKTTALIFSVVFYLAKFLDDATYFGYSLSVFFLIATIVTVLFGFTVDVKKTILGKRVIIALVLHILGIITFNL